MSTTETNILPAPTRGGLPAWLAAIADDTAPGAAMIAGAPTLAGSKRPDHDTILQAYTTYRRELVRFAALVAPQDGIAEDLVQEAFVRLYKSWGQVADHDKVGGYLRKTVLNLARGRGRRLGLARRQQPEHVPDEVSAETHALASLGGQDLVAALRTLPRRQRECLVLRYFEGCGEREIAETLGISVGSARTHVHRGTATLRTRLGGSR